MTIKEALANLDNQMRKQIMYAFENDLSQVVKVSENLFLGVNVNGDFKIIEQVNNWVLFEKE